jgi:hypothetical protein
VWRHARQLIVLTAGAAVAIVLMGSAPALAWGSGEHGEHGTPVVHTTTPTPRPYCPPTRPPVTRPPVTRPPVTRPPVTRPPVTHPPSTPPPTLAPTTLPVGGGHTAGGPTSTTKPVTTTTLPTTTTAPALTAVGAAAGPVARLDTFDTFQAFVKGLEANARAESARAAAVRAARASAARNLAVAVPAAGGQPAAVEASPEPAPDLFPHGPLFNDSPAPLLPLGASGLRSARSFVLLFGLSAVALGFLAFRARLARRHGMFGTATYDDRGDYVDFA